TPVPTPTPTPTPAPTTVNDTVTGTGNNQWDYGASGWNYYAGPNLGGAGAYQNDEHYATTTNVRAHFRFNGAQVKIYTVLDPNGGNIGYSLDGSTEQVVSNYFPVTT